MCRVLKISRSAVYYKGVNKEADHKLSEVITDIFLASKNYYGTRKIKVELRKKDYIVSRRRIGVIMKENGLVSNYTVAQYKVHTEGCNESKIQNLVNREFKKQSYLKAVVSDLTYVRVGSKWHYICVLVDLFNREIIGYSAGANKDSSLVARAFATVQTNLENIQIFHTDRGNEFKNKLIDQTLETFDIKRSLSKRLSIRQRSSRSYDQIN